MSSRVVLLGGTGFLGSHLAVRLRAEGFDVLSVGRRAPGVHDVHAAYAALDIFQQDELSPLLRDADVCIHLVTDTVPSNAERNGYAGIERNLGLAFRVADTCAKLDVRKLIFASSGGTVYGKDVLDAREDSFCAPIGFYGVQKLAIEAMLRSRLRYSHCKLVNLRIGNPYGAGQERQRAHGLVGHLLNSLIGDTPFTVWGDGTQVRDYVDIRDVTDAFLCAMAYSGDEDTFNIGTSVGTSTNEMIAICQEVAGRRLGLTYGAHPAYDVDRISLNIEKARCHLSWVPQVALQDGIRNYYQDLTEEAQ